MPVQKQHVVNKITGLLVFREQACPCTASIMTFRFWKKMLTNVKLGRLNFDINLVCSHIGWFAPGACEKFDELQQLNHELKTWRAEAENNLDAAKI